MISVAAARGRIHETMIKDHLVTLYGPPSKVAKVNLKAMVHSRQQLQLAPIMYLILLRGLVRVPLDRCLGLRAVPVYTGDTGAVLRVRTPYRRWVVQQNIRPYLYGSYTGTFKIQFAIDVSLI